MIKRTSYLRASKLFVLCMILPSFSHAVIRINIDSDNCDDLTYYTSGNGTTVHATKETHISVVKPQKNNDIKRSIQSTCTVNRAADSVHTPCVLPDNHEIKPVSNCTAKQMQPSFFTRVLHSMVDNKFKSIFGMLCLAWLTMQAKMAFDAQALEKSTFWGSWKSNMEAQELYTTPQKKIIKEFEQAIMMKYNSTKNPIKHCLSDIHQELKQLKQFLAMHAWLDWLNLTPFFPVQFNLQAQAHRKIHRLEYLHRLISMSDRS